MGVEGTTTAGTAELIVNGSSLGSRRYPVGWTTVTWPSASTVWHAGVNRVRCYGCTPARLSSCGALSLHGPTPAQWGQVVLLTCQKEEARRAH